MNFQQNIPCPDCGESIPIDSGLLLQGHEFTCPGCLVSISLAAESKGIVKESLHKFNNLKNSNSHSQDFPVQQ